MITHELAVSKKPSAHVAAAEDGKGADTWPMCSKHSDLLYR